MKNYPEKATENFDTATFHIQYCLYFIKKFVSGKVLEVGAGCGVLQKITLIKIINLLLQKLIRRILMISKKNSKILKILKSKILK